MLFCTFLCRPVVARLQHETCQLHLLSVKIRQPFPFSFCELIYRPLDFYSRKNQQHHVELDGLRTMNFEAAQIHFLSDVFAAVAVVVVLMQLMFTAHFFFSERSLETFL